MHWGSPAGLVGCAAGCYTVAVVGHSLPGPGASGVAQSEREQLSPRNNSPATCWPDSSVVERGPEKAGVGGSIPSLATTLLAMLAIALAAS